MGRWHRLAGAPEETGPLSPSWPGKGSAMPGSCGRRAHRLPCPGPCAWCLYPILGAGSPRAPTAPLHQRAPGSQACPQGPSQEPAVPRALHLGLCPSESLLGQVVGRTPGDCSPSPDGRRAGALGTWLFQTLLATSRAQQSREALHPRDQSCPSAQASAASSRREGCPGGAEPTVGRAGCSDR